MAHTLRIAFRSLRRRPGFSALAIVTIALGAGANAAVSAVAYGVLLKPLPLAEPDRVVAVWPGRFMSQVDLRYLRDHTRGLSSVSGIAPGWTFSLTGAGDPSKITVDRVSGNLFETVGATPRLGRVLRSDEDTPGAAKVLVLSHRFWRARFGGDPSVVGRRVRLDDVPHEIVGVMPSSFEILTRADAWAPLPADRAAFYDKLNFSLLVGRLAPGTSLDQADRDFKALMPPMRGDLKYPATFGRTARIQDLRAAMTGDMRSSLTVLAAAVGFMLLIAGANLGTLLVASSASRAREFAVRAAIGASRGSLVRLQLIEGLVLAAAGAVAGLALATWGLPVLVRLLPKDTPRTGDIHVDGAVMLTVVGAALLVALLFAIVPALTAGRTSGAPLREGASTESRVTRRARGLMVSVEIALALVLTIGAGLMVRTLWHLNRVDPGIDVDRILTLRLQPSGAGYKAPGAVAAYYEQVLGRIAALPGVVATGAIQHLPFSGIAWFEAFEIEGRPVAAGESRPTAGSKLITGDYFAAVGQRLLAGRTFSSADRTGARALIVNEAFARANFGSAAAAIDRRIRIGRVGGPWVPIAGVVRDVRTESLDKPSGPEVYAVATGSGMPALMLAVRTDGDPVSIAASVRDAVWTVDRNVPIADLQPMRTMVGTTLARPRLLLTLLSAFAVTGLALGAIGVYGVVAFGVARRRREIGIRMALGADRAGVIRLMLGESAGYAAAGLIAGMGLALACSRMMQGLLFEVPVIDAPTYLGLALGVALLVTLASYAPARRAASINPAEALRADR
jgi:putative ABC transport system permease protein